jgi:septal ring factor EnvC (AmiA/AmiB activator)
MKKNPSLMITAAAVMALMMIGAGCASKKHLLKIEQQGTEIQQSQERIAELQRNNEILTGTLNETKASLAKAEEGRAEADKQITALNSDVSALQSRNEDLSKSMEALNKENEGKVRRLNGQIYSLRKQQTEKDEQIAAKDGEIASLKSLQASLEGTVAARDQQISRLNEEKASEAAASAKTISGKNLRITILGVLLALAIIVAVFALFKRKKRS